MQNYVANRVLRMQGNPDVDEAWIQQLLATNPSLLGLGTIALKQREKVLPGSGRLDLLFEHEEEKLRYEVEVQLGATDESHIIRTIEYWNLEQHRYPQYEHVAVLVAEDVTSRFLNVLQFFSTRLPLIVLQMKLLEVGSHKTIFFTRVVDMRLPEEEEAQADAVVVDRAYWEERAGPSLAVVDACAKIAKTIDPNLQLNYKQGHIGFVLGVKPKNFMWFHPKQKFCRVGFRTQRDEAAVRQDAEGLGIEVVSMRDDIFKVRLTAAEMTKHAAAIERWMREGFTYFA